MARKERTEVAGRLRMAVIGGEYAKLSEIAFALKFGRPVVALHTWSANSPKQTALPIHIVDSTAVAVTAVLAALRSHQSGQWPLRTRPSDHALRSTSYALLPVARQAPPSYNSISYTRYVL